MKPAFTDTFGLALPSKAGIAPHASGSLIGRASHRRSFRGAHLDAGALNGAIAFEAKLDTAAEGGEGD